MPAFLFDDGQLQLDPYSDAFSQSDSVGMNARLASNYEGTPLPPFGDGNSDRAYARIGVDTNDNSRDFAMRGPSGPQNSTMCRQLT